MENPRWRPTPLNCINLSSQTRYCNGRPRKHRIMQAAILDILVRQLGYIHFSVVGRHLGFSTSGSFNFGYTMLTHVPSDCLTLKIQVQPLESRCYLVQELRYMHFSVIGRHLGFSTSGSFNFGCTVSRVVPLEFLTPITQVSHKSAV